jgi:hypothetical protein
MGKVPVPVLVPDLGPDPPPDTTDPGSIRPAAGSSIAVGAATARVTAVSGATASRAWACGSVCCSDCCAVKGVHSKSTSTTHKGDNWRIRGN